MRRFLVSSYCLWIVTTACSPVAAQTLQSKEVRNPYFPPSAEAQVYRSDLNYKGNSWAGILAIRHDPEEKYEIIWMDEMGRTLMDAVLEKGQWTYHYLLPQLDKWMIRKILKNDFRLLLSEKLEVKKTEQSGDTLLFRNGDKIFAYHEQRLTRIEDTRGLFSAVKIFFEKNGTHIQMDHLRMDLSIGFVRIEAASLSGSEEPE